jgi:ribonuclease HI
LKAVEIFTDGACRGNPGPGGWGVLLRCKGQEKTLHGGAKNTTNNRMELMAATQHSIQWHWVKGHSGHRENEIADQLANLGIDEL